ncbi:MAG: MoxR family ATPase [Planctomycetes bacterium]|nr:MoxR family ATPase [Planctomycetota bacterium]
MQSQDIKDITQLINEKSHILTELVDEVGKVIVGQKYLIERLVIGILANGHILLEGVPGLAKTLTVMSLAKAIKAQYQRVQFTPDLLPADLIGTLIYNPRDGEFSTKKGPIFSNIILADEINRAPAKVQSALLEAMQEKQVTIGENTFKLEEPFLVLATQNPIEQEGTYPLPEAQIDRFMLKLIVGYPSKQEEREILEKKAVTDSNPNINTIISAEDIKQLRSVVDQIYIDDKIKDYIVDLVFASREPGKYNLDIDEFIEFGASPRATIYLAVASKAYAFLRGRGYVTPQDVKTIGMDVLRHRIIITYEAEAEELTPEKIIQKIFDNVEVP